MTEDKKFNLNLTKLALMALLLRFLIMPFSFHGHDIFWLNYFPFKFIEGEVHDPYLYISENSAHMKGAYYPPIAFYICVFFQFLFKPFLPKLKELYSIFTLWNFKWEGNTIHFANILTDHQLFRALFFFKVPYLICDFIIGFALYQLLKEDKRKAFIALIIWALNPFVLQSIYALGQLDIIVTMFIILSVLAIKMKRPYLAVTCLSLGGGVKIIPLVLIPLVVFILGRDFKEKIKLALVSLVIFLLPFVPFYLSSKFAAFKIFSYYNVRISPLRRDVFIVAYFCLLAIFHFLKRKDVEAWKAVTFSFVSILLLFYTTYEVTLRFFVWITPLLIITAIRNKIFWLYNFVFFVTLFELRTCGNSQQWGLFAALHPEFFSSLPIADSFLNLLVNVKYIHQYMYKLFIIFSLLMIAHILPLYIRNEKS